VRQADVPCIFTQPIGENVGAHGALRNSLEGQGRNEALRARGHDDVNQRARLHQLGGEVGHLVGGYAAGYAEDDMLGFKCGHQKSEIRNQKSEVSYHSRTSDS
jgi:hypothetical protein